MTSIEKAKELAMKFDKYGETDNAKQCALIAVDEILEIIRYHGTDIGKYSLMFWIEIKQEIE